MIVKRYVARQQLEHEGSSDFSELLKNVLFMNLLPLVTCVGTTSLLSS